MKELEKCLRRRRSSRDISFRSEGRREMKQVYRKAQLPGEKSFPLRDDPALAGKPRNANRPAPPQGELDAAEIGGAATAGRPSPHRPRVKGLKKRPRGA